MSRVLYILSFLVFALGGQAQQVCELAYEIDEPQNFCAEFSFENAVYSEPSTSCNPTSAPNNLWFTFVSDGLNVVINANHETSENVYFSIIQFTTVDCDEEKFIEIACGVNNYIGAGVLEEGVKYYVVLEVEDNLGGNVDFCLHSQHDTPPPANDEPCNAITLELDNFCILGSTQYAEVDQDSFPCGEDFTQDVWYKFQLTEELAFGTDISVTPSDPNAEFQIKLVQFTFDTCTSTYVTRKIDCDGSDGYDIQSTGLDLNINYYIVVSSKNDDTPEFELCINQLIADENTLRCFPEIITVNGEPTEVDLFHALHTTDLPGCDFSNKLKYYEFDSGTELQSVEITLDSLGIETDVFLGFAYHQNNTCLQEFIWVNQFCGTVEDARMTVTDLMPNTEYLVVVGNNANFTDKFKLTINGNYPNPFYNASPCTAYELTPGQSCIGGTSAVGGTAPGDIDCYETATQTENWYKIRREAFPNPEVLFENFTNSEHYEFSIGYFPQGCTNDFIKLEEICSINDGFAQEISIPDSIEFVFMSAIFAAEQTRNFKLCIDFQDAPATCNENDFCHEAISLGMLSTQVETCFAACTYNATQENTFIPVLNEYPSVWYSFEINQESTISLTFGEAYDARYYVSLASSNDCNDFIVHDIKYAFVTDDSFLRFNVPSSGTFYLIVSSMEEEGGFVNICVEQEEISACSTDDRLRVTNTSMGSLLSGPFQPQEVISFCYDLPAYQPGELSDCQWVQGIVPSFGMGWSDNSFDSLGMPIQSSIIQSVNENISWNWYDDVNVNVDNNNVFMSYNQRALLDLCHSTEVNCAGSPVVTGDLLPPGWFAHKTNEHPEDSGGDGLNCSNSQGPWQICFDLIATEEADLEISMFTFADGLIANDNFINDYCLNDLPECQTYFVECQSNPIDTSYNIITCNEVATVLFSEGSSRYFWTTPAVDNLENNFSGSGSSLEVNLTNLTDTIIQAEYFVKEFDETGCQLSEIHIIIDVYPSIEIPRPSTTTVCMNDSIQMDEIVDLDQYILGSFAVDWNSTNVDNNQNAFWNGTDDDTISYSVYSQATCTFQDTFIIDIENVIVEEFVTDQTLCAGEILDFHQALPLNEIVEDSFTVEWNLSGIPDDPFATTVINESTDISFEIIGERGCVYNDTFNVYVPSITLQSNMDNKLCSSDEILLNATISSDLISDFYWLTPKGISIALNNFVVPADNFDMGLNVFEFNVESIEGCLFSISDSVTLYQVPEVNVEGIVDTSGICSYEEITVNSVVSPEIYDITWFTPTGVLDTSNFTTSTQGDYFYITGYTDNEISCLSIDSFYVEIYPDVETGFTYDELICVNDTTEIISEIPTYKFVWSTGSNGSTILATPGEYSVTVSNDFGCVQDYEFEISERALPAPLFSYDFSICEGDSTLIMPLDSQYNYEWNSGNTNNSEISFGGAHSVTVTDEIMCTDSFDFFVDVLVYPNVQLSYEINQDTLFLMNLTDDDFDCSYVLDDLVIPMANDTFLVLQEGDYTLSLQCANGDCSDAESVDFSIVVSGVEPQRISSLKLYPNPNNGDFNLSFEGGFLETIEIYSSEGRIVRKELVNQSNSYTYQSNLAQGVYWLKCTMDDQVVTQRIVVL